MATAHGPRGKIVAVAQVADYLDGGLAAGAAGELAAWTGIPARSALAGRSKAILAPPCVFHSWFTLYRIYRWREDDSNVHA
jgi:hypothetical protein